MSSDKEALLRELADALFEKHPYGSFVGKGGFRAASAFDLADAVLPIVERESAELVRLREAVTALADDLEGEAQRHDPDKRLDGKRFSVEMAEAFRASMTAKRDAAARLRSLLDKP